MKSVAIERYLEHPTPYAKRTTFKSNENNIHNPTSDSNANSARIHQGYHRGAQRQVADVRPVLRNKTLFQLRFRIATANRPAAVNSNHPIRTVGRCSGAKMPRIRSMRRERIAADRKRIRFSNRNNRSVPIWVKPIISRRRKCDCAA